MSAIAAPAVHPSPVGRFPGLAIAVTLIAVVIATTVWIDRSNSIVTQDTVVEPSPSGMY